MSGRQTFSLWLLQVLILLGLLIFFLWLSLRPSEPTYIIVDFSAPTANDTGNGTVVSFGIDISNDNRGGGVYYSNMNVTMYLGDESVGSTIVPDFYQGHGKTARKMGSVSTSKRVRKALAKRAAELKVALVAAVRYRIWWWRSRLNRMDMQASVPLGTDGKVSGKCREIKLHRSRKKWRLRVHRKWSYDPDEREW